MNFEYKVGYLWKYHEEDPGQEKLKSRKRAETARTDGQPPERIYKFCLPTVLREWMTARWLIWVDLTFSAPFRPGTALGKSFFSFFSFLSFFFSFPLLSSLLSPPAACWNWPFEGVRVPGWKKLKLGSCPDWPRALPTCTGSCVSRFLLKFSTKFCKIKVISSPPNLFLVKVGMIYT